MKDNILNDEPWFELWEAINLFDRKGDRTALNRILVPIMKDLVEYLDDDVQPNEYNDAERQLVITLIEAELAEIIAVHACPSWCCCRRRRIQPFNSNTNKFSNCLINIARAKSFDKNNSGLISKEMIQSIFGTKLSNENMAELLQFVETDNVGNINYKDFATLVFAWLVNDLV